MILGWKQKFKIHTKILSDLDKPLFWYTDSSEHKGHISSFFPDVSFQFISERNFILFQMALLIYIYSNMKIQHQ